MISPYRLGTLACVTLGGYQAVPGFSSGFVIQKWINTPYAAATISTDVTQPSTVQKACGRHSEP